MWGLWFCQTNKEFWAERRGAIRAFLVARRLSVGYWRKEKQMILYSHCTHALQKGFQGIHHLSFSSPLVSDDPLCFAAEGPQVAAGSVQWNKQLCQWCAVFHCSPSPYCAAASVRHLLHLMHLHHAAVPRKLCLPKWYQRPGLGKQRQQTWSTRWSRFGSLGQDGTWTVPSQQAVSCWALVWVWQLTHSALTNAGVWCVCVHTPYPQWLCSVSGLLQQAHCSALCPPRKQVLVGLLSVQVALLHAMAAGAAFLFFFSLCLIL